MSVPRSTVEQRKAMPLASGVLDYFPDALLVVAEVSRIGNEQHHPGEPLHWDKSKSTDEADALMRHLLDRGTLDTDGVRHSAKVAWRALALLQRELDAEDADAYMDRVRAAQTTERLPCDWVNTGQHDPWCPRIDLAGGQDIGHRMFRGQYRDAWDSYGAVTNRGEWPPDTRVGGLLTCCGASEHPLECPQYRD